MSKKLFPYIVVVVLIAVLFSSCGGGSSGFYNGYALYENSLVVNYTNLGARALIYSGGHVSALAEKTCRLTFEDNAFDVIYYEDSSANIRIVTPTNKKDQPLADLLRVNRGDSADNGLMVQYAMGYKADCAIIVLTYGDSTHIMLADLTQAAMREITLERGEYPLAISPDSKYMLYSFENELHMYDLKAGASGGDIMDAHPTLAVTDMVRCSIYMENEHVISIYDKEAGTRTIYDINTGEAKPYYVYASADKIPQTGGTLYASGIAVMNSGGVLSYKLLPDATEVKTDIIVSAEDYFNLQNNVFLSPSGDKLALEANETVYIIDTASGEYKTHPYSDYNSYYALNEYAFSWIDDSTLIYNSGTLDGDGVMTVVPHIIKL